MTFALEEFELKEYRRRDKKARQAKDAEYVIPRWDVTGQAVLDIGCYDGRHLMLPELYLARRWIGIDVDAAAIQKGRRLYETLELHIAPAEKIPLPDASIDTAYSKVALPYTDIRAALAEIRRVLKSGGRLQLTLHDWKLQAKFLAQGWKSPKRWIDHAYIAYASAVFAWRGHVPVRPWNGTRETFQTRRAMRRELELAGFSVTRMERNTRQWIVEATAR